MLIMKMTEVQQKTVEKNIYIASSTIAVIFTPAFMATCEILFLHTLYNKYNANIDPQC